MKSSTDIGIRDKMFNIRLKCVMADVEILPTDCSNFGDHQRWASALLVPHLRNIADNQNDCGIAD
jgi:hypothetical protein